jgi:hypothetical protein
MLLHTLRDTLLLIRTVFDTTHVAVRWRSGSTSHCVPGSIPGEAAMAYHFDLID